jgi:hypothetical protein
VVKVRQDSRLRASGLDMDWWMHVERRKISCICYTVTREELEDAQSVSLSRGECGEEHFGNHTELGTFAM